MCNNLCGCCKSKCYIYNTETNLYIPVVILSTQDNAKLLPQLKSGFKRTISWNKYLAKPALLARNENLNHLIEPSFQEVNRLFVLAFEDDAQSFRLYKNNSFFVTFFAFFTVLILRNCFHLYFLKTIQNVL